jgi:hypothetical protein
MPDSFMQFITRHRWTLLALFLVTPLGFYTKFYHGPAEGWVHNSLGGFFYVIFWTILFSIPFYRVRPWKIALAVLVTTSLLEVLQLWHPPFLEAIRSTFLGGALLGNSFVWSDFLYYLSGCLICLALVPNLRRKGTL